MRSWGACCPAGQTALAPAAPQWPIQSFSSPEVSPQPGLERERVCVKEVCVGREIGKNTLDPQRSLGIGLHFASSFLLPSRRLQLTLCFFPLTPKGHSPSAPAVSSRCLFNEYWANAVLEMLFLEGLCVSSSLSSTSGWSLGVEGGKGAHAWSCLSQAPIRKVLNFVLMEVSTAGESHHYLIP